MHPVYFSLKNSVLTSRHHRSGEITSSFRASLLAYLFADAPFNSAKTTIFPKIDFTSLTNCAPTPISRRGFVTLSGKTLLKAPSISRKMATRHDFVESGVHSRQLGSMMK